jgi:hypothetical protein
MTINQLSSHGQRRRNEILTLVLEESVRVQRRRKRRLRLGAAAMTLIMATVAFSLWSPPEPTSHRPQASRTPDEGPSSPLGFDLERHLVRSEVDDLGQYLVSTREQIPAGVLLDDTELLGTLAELDRVEGIIRVDGKTWLRSDIDSR